MDKIRTFPDVGKRPDNKNFSTDVNNIYKAQEQFNKIGNLKSEKSVIKLSGGDPIKCKPFKLCKKYLKEAINDNEIYKYPPAAGNEKYREKIVQYLNKEKFAFDSNIEIDNTIVTFSTSHGYKLVLDAICRPYDVVLMVSPCYGLFTFFSERINVETRLIEVSKEEDYYINAKKLEQTIDKINNELKEKYDKKLGYTPRVVALLNQNPHNPTGKVMGKDKLNLLNDIAKVCKEKNVYIIDDLVYRDITFDSKKLAVPFSSIKGNFANTITLLGLSKCYGYASARAGLVVGDKEIIEKVRDLLFQDMDSSSVLQASMLAGAFNTTKKRYKEYHKYFGNINREYEYQFYLLKALIDGIDSLENVIPINMSQVKLNKRIKKDVMRYNKKNYAELLKGIKDVQILENITSEGGFFALIDFSNLKNSKVFKEKNITTDQKFLEAIYQKQGIKFLTGGSIGFNEDRLIARFSFAIDKKDIIESIYRIKLFINELEE